MSYTPGPWTVHDGEQEWEGDGEPPEREFRWWVGEDSLPSFVAEVLTLPDARLIAAAPDLLAALNDIANLTGLPEFAIAEAEDIARAAIEKAGGTENPFLSARRDLRGTE